MQVTKDGDHVNVLTNKESIIKGHNIRCERARTPKKDCKCQCGGKYHGISARLDDYYNDPHEMVIDETFGGKLWRTAMKLLKKKMTCTCGHTFPLTSPKGYLHDGGLEDKDGKSWWLYYTCPKCEYDWSWWKLTRRIRDGMI